MNIYLNSVEMNNYNLFKVCLLKVSRSRTLYIDLI